MDGRECGRRKGARGKSQIRRGEGAAAGRPRALGPGGRAEARPRGVGARPGRGAGGGREGVREGERGRGGEPRGREGQRKSPGRRRWRAEERNEEPCVGVGSSQKGNATRFRFYSLSGRGGGGLGSFSLLSPLFILLHSWASPLSPPFETTVTGKALSLPCWGGFPVIFQWGVWWVGRGGGLCWAGLRPGHLSVPECV